MYWRLGPRYRERPRERNERSLYRLVKRGPPPGLLALDGAMAVGWCQLTPRADLPWLDGRPALARVDEVPVWCISCFYVRRAYRRQGVAAALIAAALREARRAGAPALEAYPYEAATGCSFTGNASMFARAGFTEIARHVGNRPIMRRDLRRSSGRVKPS
jgi:GNAT superfamily N-acetyltransferase